METLTINARSLNLTENQFFNLCQENDWLHFELTAEKEILVRPPKGTIIGMYSAKLNGELGSWNKLNGLGYCFGPNAGFTLPN